MGVTSDLSRRVWEHKIGAIDGFTKRYETHMLIYAEFHATMEEAILREKRIKTWRRAWKPALIEKTNATWCDLYNEIGY